MYPLEWVERLRLAPREWTRGGQLRRISPVVWALGLTSLLTDISTEMVASILPVYLVLHLHLSPLQFAAIDGIYNGLSVALVAVLAALFADRKARQKQVAGFGYALSAFCKIALLLVGGAWGLIMTVVGLDRLGKGIRTAPRDSIISLHTRPELLGTAFGVHRGLDATGALLGPLVAFVLLAQIPGAFNLLWVISFVVACLGFAALWLLVPSSQPVVATDAELVAPSGAAPLRSRRFVSLSVCGALLALLTVSDAFIYLLLQQRSQVAAGYVPLFYVGTAMAYMVFAVPAGLLADRYGRTRIYLTGYGVLIALYGAIYSSAGITPPLLLGCLALLGLYYAATEGVLMALASAIVPRDMRATGLAVLATSVGIAKLVSSIGFGWIWQIYGAQAAIAAFAIGGVVAVAVVAPKLRVLEHG